MNKYYCKGCDDIILRECNSPILISICSTANDKKITLVKVNEDISEIFNLLKKLSK